MFCDIYVYMQLFFFSILLMVLMYKFMLVLLMIVELVVLNISVMMFLIFSMMNMEFYMIYYLVFSICEGSLGLSLLVMIIRYYGNEMYNMFNMSKF